MEPRTYVGQWLEAILARDDQRAREVRPHLNGGARGWTDDEPAVAEAVFDTLVRMEFSAETDSAKIAEFAADIQARAAQADTQGKYEHARLEAVVQKALGWDVSVDHLSAIDQYLARGIVSSRCAITLKLDRDTIRGIVVDAETTAFERGFKPLLAV